MNSNGKVNQMAKARFELYVEERVAELSAGRRAKLQAALDAEIEKVERQRDKYVKAIEDGVEALVRKVVGQARRAGCDVGETGVATSTLSVYAQGQVRDLVGPRTAYDYESGERLWPEGTPARKAQDALMAFDDLCAKEARRIVVYKMDLGMKPEAFEEMMANVAMKINNEEK